MATDVPGNFNSSVNTGLPLFPLTPVSGTPEYQDLLNAYQAIQVLSIELSKVKARLTAAGIP